MEKISSHGRSLSKNANSARTLAVRLLLMATNYVGYPHGEHECLI
jgi:hypothetical protein